MCGFSQVQASVVCGRFHQVRVSAMPCGFDRVRVSAMCGLYQVQAVRAEGGGGQGLGMRAQIHDPSVRTDQSLGSEAMSEILALPLWQRLSLTARRTTPDHCMQLPSPLVTDSVVSQLEIHGL